MNNNQGKEMNLSNGIKSCQKNIEKLIGEIDQISGDYEVSKSAIVRKYGEVSELSEEERSNSMKKICDDLEIQIKQIELSNELTDEEKDELLDSKYAILSNNIELYENFGSMTPKEQEEYVEKSIKLETASMEVEKQVKKQQIIEEAKKSADYLKLMVSRGYSHQNVYEAYKTMVEKKFPGQYNEDIQKAFYEEVMSDTFEKKNRFDKKDYLSEIIISYSELEEHKKENDISSGNSIDDETKEQEDANIENPENVEPQELEAVDPEKEDEPRVDSESEPSKDEDVMIPKNVQKKPKLTWKTAVAVAAGVGVGATVFFTAGPTGVIVMGLAGTIGKIAINHQLKKLQEQKLSGEQPVVEVNEPRPGLKGKFDEFKKYIKSEEGLRDLSWLINSAIITGSGLSIASSITNAITAAKQSTISQVPGTTSGSVTQTVTNTSTASANTPNTVTIDKVFDSASYASNGINAETPLKYISESAGSHISEIRDGMALVRSGNGVAQGWFPANGAQVGDIVEAAVNVGGKAL